MHIFPESGFDQSVTTPVLLGVLVAWFFTESYGWVFAGLVVPGYLAALFLVHPRSALIDIVEAVITYGIARLLGEQLARSGLTSRVFGRERFLLILLVSVLVRLGFEGVVLAQTVGYAHWAFSTGLVVVPLAANACWKTGLWRGIVQNGVPTAIVYLLLRYVLLAHTNLSLAGFHLATENVAASFLASPKAYMLLLTGALIAAIANLRYGWDFNGILIPALLALVAMNPVKLAATFAEVLVLLGVVTLLLRTTPLGRWNIEGPRRPTLFFTVDYGLRFVFATFVGRSLPGADVVELMGFGYLLPTLLAVKVTQRGSTPLVLLPTLTVSCVAFVSSSLIGFAAMALDDAPYADREPVTRRLARAPNQPLAAALWLSALARPSATHGAVLSDSRLPRLMQALLDDPATQPPPHLEAQRLDGGVVLLRERFQSLPLRVGEPAVLAAPTPPSAARVVLLVPTPLAAPETAALAGRLLEQHAADAVVVAGVEERESRSTSLSAAQGAARGLADRFRGLLRQRGLVIALQRSGVGEAAVRLTAGSEHDARAAIFLRALRAQLGGLPKLPGSPARGEDIAVSVPLERINDWLPAAAPTDTQPSTLETAAMFDDAGAATSRATLEDSLALQRLVLAPLLDRGAPPVPLSLTRAAAGALGYRLVGPSRLADGDEALELLAGAAPKPITLIVRARAASGLVLAVPQAQRGALRQLGVQLGAALRADAMLFGFQPGAGVLANQALSEALALATHAAAGATPSVVLLRELDDVAKLTSDSALATWGGTDADRLALSVESALQALELHATRGALDVGSREDAGRGVFGDAALVTLSVGPHALRSRADAAELAARFPSLTVIDDACGPIALQLARALPSAADDAPEALLESARRAVVERSIVASRALEQALATTASRAALARSVTGAYLVVAGRTRHGLLLGAFPLAELGDRGEFSVRAAGSLDACAALLSLGGACRIAGTP
jgi:hypothetical protein